MKLLKFGKSKNKTNKAQTKKFLNYKMLVIFAVVFAAAGAVTILSTSASQKVLFEEDFTGNQGLERFSYGAYHRNLGYGVAGSNFVRWGDGNAGHGGSWTGDHDLNCGSPDTQRSFTTSKNNPEYNNVAYNCRDHMMTSMGDVDNYSIVWFSPNETLNDVKEISFNVNLTYQGRRQWFKVGLVSEERYNRMYSGGSCLKSCQVPGFIVSDIGASGVQHPLQGNDILVATWGGGASGGDGGGMKIGDTKVGYSENSGNDKATRFPVTLRDNGNGTVSFIVNGVTTTRSGSFPTGPARVVFYDHNYTPDKDGRPIGHTLHWDNIKVLGEATDGPAPDPQEPEYPDPQNELPTVSLATSVTNVTAPGNVTVTANASDSDGSVSKIELLQNGEVIETCTNRTSCSKTLTNLSANTYQFTAIATDDDGGVTTSQNKSVAVNEPDDTPIPNPDPGRFTTLPVGSTLPSGTECASRVRPAAEVRPANAEANNTRGVGGNYFYTRVDGNYTGTTDEIIQWAACKWGMDEDLLKAQMVRESYWHQSAIGDFSSNPDACSNVYPIGNYPPQYGGDSSHNNQCPESYGLSQVRWLYHKSAFFTSENEVQANLTNNAIYSTAYNVDYWGAVWRSCFDGEMNWLNSAEKGKDYVAGDATGCLGVWFSGRWYTQRAVDYIAAVNGILADRTWETTAFKNSQPVNTIPEGSNDTGGGGSQPKEGDVNGDDKVTIVDLSILLSNYGRTSGVSRAQGDLNGDGRVNVTDLSVLLRNYGS